MVIGYIDQCVNQPNVFVFGCNNRLSYRLAIIQVIPMLLEWNQGLVHHGVLHDFPIFFSSIFGRPILCDTNRSFGKYLAAPRPTRERVDTPTSIPLTTSSCNRRTIFLIGLPQYKHMSHPCLPLAENRAFWRLGDLQQE